MLPRRDVLSARGRFAPDQGAVLRIGVVGSSLRRIAEGADPQPGSLYFHFETTDEQLRTAVAAHTRSLHMSGVRGSAVARVAETLPPALRRRYANSATGYTRLCNQLLIAAQSAGDLDSELDVRAVRGLLFSAMNGTLAYRDQGSSRIEQATQTLIRLVFRV